LKLVSLFLKNTFIMRYLKFLFFGFLFASNASLQAQQNLGFKHEIGVSPFSVEWNSETENSPIVAKGFYRVFYNRHFEKWTWMNSFGHGKNNINDKSEGCGDCFVGTGKMKEFVATTGLRYHFFRKSYYRIRPFLEPGLYFSNMHYSGEFDGGLWGQGTSLNFSNEVVGIYGQFGLSYSPTPRVSLQVSASYRGGKDFFGKRQVGSHGLTLLQLGVGFFPFK
jgi:hypothetical protein